MASKNCTPKICKERNHIIFARLKNIIILLYILKQFDDWRKMFPENRSISN